MRIAGIDIDSRKFGAVCIEEGFYTGDYFHLSTCKNVDDRIAELYDEIERLLIRWLPDKVYIEEPIYIQNFKTTKAISETVGNCKSLCRIHKIAYETVPNKTWKKEIIGKGNCSKEDTKKFIEKKDPMFVGRKEDVYDAYGICLWGVKKNK
jgi:Holliday junction resolvasome RuvABC endonuclease subunit